MANAKISALAAGTAPAGTEVLPGVQSAATVKFTINQLLSIQAGRVGINATEITVSRDLTAADFDAGPVFVINAAGVVAITVPTVAAMALPSTTGQIRYIAFYVKGAGIPTFAGKTGSTILNGTAGTTTVLPLGGAPVRYGHYVLTQAEAGSDSWSLE